jgi:signal transduction histidine kinase
MALARLSDDDPLHADLAVISRAANRASNLVEQLLHFSKNKEPKRYKLKTKNVLDGLIKEYEVVN